MCMCDKPDLQKLEKVEIRMPWVSPSDQRIKHPFGEIVTALVMIECTSRLFELGHITFYNHILALITLTWSLYELLIINIYYIRSDERGFTLYRVIRRQFLKWDNIKAITIKTNMGQLVGCKFIGKDQTIWLPLPFPHDRMESVLVASIWQHLRRIGKADEFPFPKEAEDLWWSVPDCVPDSVSWINRHAPEWKVYYKLLWVKVAALIILLTAGIIVFGLSKTSTVIKVMILVLGGVYAALWFYLRRVRTIAITASVNSESIEVETGFGNYNLQWSKVISSGWDSDGLILKAISPKVTVRIPDQSSASTILLAIIKRLRPMDSHKWLAVPEALRKATGNYSEAVLVTGKEHFD